MNARQRLLPRRSFKKILTSGRKTTLFQILEWTTTLLLLISMPLMPKHIALDQMRIAVKNGLWELKLILFQHATQSNAKLRQPQMINYKRTQINGRKTILFLISVWTMILLQLKNI